MFHFDMYARHDLIIESVYLWLEDVNSIQIQIQIHVARADLRDLVNSPEAGPEPGSRVTFDLHASVERNRAAQQVRQFSSVTLR